MAPAEASITATPPALPIPCHLLNTTLVGNTAGTGGGNLYLGSVSSANVTLKNTLVVAGSPNNCDKAVTSQGHNLESANSCGLAAAGDLVNTDPKLGPLQNNGGSTRTYALLYASPAIDAGTNTGCPAIDQRGVARPVDGNKDGIAICDIGAYEASTYRSLPFAGTQVTGLDNLSLRGLVSRYSQT